MQEKEKICCFSGQAHVWERDEDKKEYFEILKYFIERYILRGVASFCVENSSDNQDFISTVNVLKEKYPYISLVVTDRKSFRALLKNTEALIVVWDCINRRAYKNIRFAKIRNVHVDYLLLPIKNKRVFKKYLHLYIENPLSLSSRKEKDQAFDKLNALL